MAWPFDAEREPYVSLETFRRSGKAVPTAVWAATDGASLLVYTNAKSGKVKRVRAGSRARVAACDARGRVRGEFADATVAIVEDAAGQDRAFERLLAKYGWQMRMLLLGTRLSGRYRDRCILRVEPAA